MIARTASPKVLIVRLDGLGDTLLTLPLLDGLKKCWPGCEITYLASPRGAAVFSGDARISELWVHELAALSRTEKWQLGQTIRACAFDLVFCLNEKFWPSLWTRMSGAPLRLGFDPGWTQPPKALLRRLTLTHWLQTPNDPSLTSIHEVERYAALAALAGCQAAQDAMHLLLPASDDAWASALTQETTLPLALHLSAKWTSEGWSADSCLSVARSILERFPDAFLYVTAGPGEERYFADAAAVLPPDRFRLLNGLSFSQWAALLRHCRALVSMDTGAVHLAAAVATPVVDIFPAMNFTHASSRWSPWQVPHRIIRRPAMDKADIFLTEIHTALEALI